MWCAYCFPLSQTILFVILANYIYPNTIVTLSSEQYLEYCQYISQHNTFRELADKYIMQKDYWPLHQTGILVISYHWLILSQHNHNPFLWRITFKVLTNTPFALNDNQYSESWLMNMSTQVFPLASKNNVESIGYFMSQHKPITWSDSDN